MKIIQKRKEKKEKKDESVGCQKLHGYILLHLLSKGEIRNNAYFGGQFKLVIKRLLLKYFLCKSYWNLELYHLFTHLVIVTVESRGICKIYANYISIRIRVRWIGRDPQALSIEHGALSPVNKLFWFQLNQGRSMWSLQSRKNCNKGI